MSIYSDHKCGAMDDFEFRQACIRENMRDRYEQDCEDCDDIGDIGTCIICNLKQKGDMNE